MKKILLFLLAILFHVVSSFAEQPTSYISFKPDMTVPYSIEKIQVTDCRAVRGFLGTPVDGSIQSWGYRGAIVEYPDTGKEGYDAGAGVDYSFNDNDGLHIGLCDGIGFDAVILRGGAHTRLYNDAASLVEPKGTVPLYEFHGRTIHRLPFLSKPYEICIGMLSRRFLRTRQIQSHDSGELGRIRDRLWSAGSGEPGFTA